MGVPVGLSLAACAAHEPSPRGSPVAGSPASMSSALSAPAARKELHCDGSPADARELGSRIVAELQSLQATQPKLAGFESWLPPAHPSDWSGSVILERGVTRSTSHCLPGRMCQSRMVFAPDGIYLWIQLALEPDLRSQAVRLWEHVGPLYFTSDVDGPPGLGTEQVSRAVGMAVEKTRQAYLETCKLPH